jgi:hypothetical protein
MPIYRSTVPGEGEMMNTPHADPLHWIAEQVADRFADSGYAFVEEDKIDGLAAILGSFLTMAGIPVNPPDTDDPDPDDDPFPLDEPAPTTGDRYPAARTPLP